MASHRHANMQVIDRKLYSLIINFFYFTEVSADAHRFMKLYAYFLPCARTLVVNNKYYDISSSVMLFNVVFFAGGYRYSVYWALWHNVSDCSPVRTKR